MLVTRVLGDCPGCRRSMCFGNVDVFGSNLLRGCGHCEYSEEIPLPAINKKILYLDQFFFSHAFRGGEARFVEAANRIRDVAGQELVAVPHSPLHETETLLWSRRDELRDFIKRTSRGAEFAAPYRVERTQILRAFRAWLANESTHYVIEEQDANNGTVHKWDSYFYIDIAPFSQDPNVVRHSKQKSVDALVALFETWRSDSTTFEQDVETEHVGAARGYIDAYAMYAARVMAGDASAMIDSPVMSMVVESMMHCLPKELPVDERLRKCGAFFKSQHFRCIPSQSISAKIYAGLKSMVKHGAYTNPAKARKRLSGFFYDVQHISTYAPYCHAIVIDQPMAELVAHPKINLEQTLGVRIFSVQDWSKLHEWLDELEQGAREEHRATLAAIHARPQQ